jgi:hypothetical protein
MKSAATMFRHSLTGLVVFLALISCPSSMTSQGLAAQSEENELCSRSLVSAGDSGRLQRAPVKAHRGETGTVGVIGGSITQGAAASQAEKRYGDFVAAWRKTFPKAKFDYVNAGIGATGSDYGALQAKQDLLLHHPDFVIIEYAVNDPDNDAAAGTLEGLVRQILGGPNSTAVALLFTMHQDGRNAQEAHAPWPAAHHISSDPRWTNYPARFYRLCSP